MRNIKVYLQYPWIVSDSQYYKSLRDYPPKGVIYTNPKAKEGMVTNKKKFLFLRFTKDWIRDLLSFLRIPLLNSHKSPKGDYDLIHCAHCIPRNNQSWVVDVEIIRQLWISGNKKRMLKKIGKILKSNKCKKIITWTETIKKEMTGIFPELEKKIEVLHYAMPLPKVKRKKHSGINLLFMGRYFYPKGGLHALEALNRLTKKYPQARGFCISNTPPEIKKAYAKNNKISFMDLMPYNKITKEIYPLMDILIYPGYSDSYGFQFIESQAFGVPVITVDGIARAEMVEDGKTGFIIKQQKNFSEENMKAISIEDEAVIEKIVDKASQLIESNNLRLQMSKNCMNEIQNGKFSLDERNKKLLQIYEKALN